MNKPQTVKPSKTQIGTDDLGRFLAGFSNFSYRLPRKLSKRWTAQRHSGQRILFV